MIINKKSPMTISTSKSETVLNGLECFDSRFSKLFQQLTKSSSALIDAMGDDISGAQVLSDLEERSGDFKSKGHLTPFVKSTKVDLYNIHSRLLGLFVQEQQEELELSQVCRFASTMFLIPEAGSEEDLTACVLLLDLLFSTSLLQPVIGGTFRTNSSSAASDASVKFALILRRILASATHRLPLTATARALARFALLSDSATRLDFVRFETARAMEWLYLPSYSKHRLASVLVLQYFASTVKTSNLQDLSFFFDHVGLAIMDERRHTRFATRDAIHVLFSVGIRNVADRDVIFGKCFGLILNNKGERSFGNSLAHVHGALLLIGELLAYADLPRQSFLKLCKLVLVDLTSVKDPLIGRALLDVIPPICSNPHFPVEYEAIAISLVFTKALVSGDFQTNIVALKSLGVLAEDPSTRHVLSLNMGEVIKVLTRGFDTVELTPVSLLCFASFAKGGLGEILFVEGGLNLLDDVFLFGLEHACIELLFALKSVVDHVKDAVPLIRARLIHEVSLCLSGHPFEVGNPPLLFSAAVSMPSSAEMKTQEDVLFFISILRKSGAAVQGGQQRLQCEALKALGTFDFGALNLLLFLEREVVPLMQDSHNETVQREALTACFQVLKHPRYWQTDIKLISSSSSKWAIVKTCLGVAAGPGSTDVRLFACEILWENASLLRTLLCQESSLSLLFSLVNDLKSFKIRVTSLQLLTFLSESNPGSILPFLRKFVLAQVSMLRNVVSKREELESCWLLETIMRNLFFRYHELGLDLLEPVLEPLVKDLLSKLRVPSISEDVSPSNALITTHLIQLLGAICLANSLKLRPLLKEAIPILISRAFDSGAVQGSREAALSTLIELLKKTRSIGLVAAQELTSPLLKVITMNVNSTLNWTLQREAIRALGTVGALDPAKLGEEVLHTKEKEEAFGWQIMAVGKPSRKTKRSGVDVSKHLEREDDSFALEYSSSSDDDDDDDNDDESDDIDNLLPVRGPIVEFGTTSQIDLDNYFRKVAIEALTRILLTETLSIFHPRVVDALGNTCRSLYHDTLPYLNRLMPGMIHVFGASSSSPDLRKNVVRQLVVFVQVLGKHMRPYLKSVFELIKIFWNDVMEEALLFLEEVFVAFKEEFHTSFSAIEWVVPLIVTTLGTCVEINTPMDNDRLLERAIGACLGLRLCISESEYAHRIASLLVAALQNPFLSHQRILILDALNELIRSEALVLDSLSLFQSISGLFQSNCPEDLVEPALHLASTLMKSNRLTLNQDFFRSMLSADQLEILRRIQHRDLDHNDDAESTEAGGAVHESLLLEEENMDVQSLGGGAYTVNAARLKEAADVSQISTSDDWAEWLRRFSVELLRESTDPTLRACAVVAQAHNLLARDLFNAAFVSCYTKLNSTDQEFIVHALGKVFEHSRTPPDVVQMLLNLCEFMEQNQRKLPIENLARFAIACHAYAKALRYLEMEFRSSASSSSLYVDELIRIYHRLDHPEAAQGLLNITEESATPLGMSKRKSMLVVLKGSEKWNEQLGRFRDALDSYQHKLDQLPEDNLSQRMPLIKGMMRCLLALGEYDRLAQVGKENWNTFDDKRKSATAPLLAHGIWEAGESWRKNLHFLDNTWGKKSPLMLHINNSTLDGAVLHVVASIQTKDWKDAKLRLDMARKLLASDLASSVAESYNRAYRQIVLAHQLTELEEVVMLSERETQEGLEELRSVWNSRLSVCQKSVFVYQQLLAVRRLALSPEDDVKVSIKFISICRTEERWGLAKSVLKRMGIADDDNVLESLRQNCSRKAIYAGLKLSWDGAQDVPPAGNQERALRALGQFVTHLDPQKEPNLLAKASLKYAEWISELRGDEAREEAMRHLDVASGLESQSSSTTRAKASHAWASLKFLEFERLGDGLHLEVAIRGFFHSIALGRDRDVQLVQDVLRLLTLWFDSRLNATPAAKEAIIQGFSSKTIPIGTWLTVVPQLIARIHSNPPCLRDLLVELGSTYPQALVYPLTVAQRSADVRVSGAAKWILKKLRISQATLLDQANMVASELIRVAILLPEEWFGALEDAAKCWYTAANSKVEGSERDLIQGRLDAFRQTQECLKDLNRRLFHPDPNVILSNHDQEFLHRHGANLKLAAELMLQYEERKEYTLPGGGNKSNHTREAWSLYKAIFQDLQTKHLPNMSVLDLADISPVLKSQTDLELCVPGANLSNESVTIRKFGSKLKVFKTKQRPRRIAMLGSQGLTYRYLLKGHEDLRQDERCMQLFSLVNVLLSKSTLKQNLKNLSIQTYVVIPLSEGVGLIGWLPQTDTMHSLMRMYRAEKEIPLNLEQLRANHVSPFHANSHHFSHHNDHVNEGLGGNTEGFDRLCLIQKVEVFEYSLATTSFVHDDMPRSEGDDLANVMWFRSRSAESWLDRRTNFIRSLATMSMVGYILGLGDRHPSNLMIHRKTGCVVHVDFGDCFEVATHRERFPELVPFRLTRQLVNAMDVSGERGDFRFSCEAVMGVLRENKDSVLAMLEAFIHDPLISWKLEEAKRKEEEKAQSEDEEEHELEDLELFLASPGLPEDEIVEEEEDANPIVEVFRPFEAARDGTSSKSVPIPVRTPSALSRSFAETKMSQSVHKSRNSVRERLLRTSKRINLNTLGEEEEVQIPLELNEQAVKVVRRVKDKLTGHDFGNADAMNCADQVNRLIKEATSHENLCGAFLGWCSFW